MFGVIIALMINNIKVGQVIKNYREFCKLMNEKIKTGKSKQLQLKEWSRYCKFHKEGYAFIIDEIYDTPLPKQDKRSDRNKYIAEIEDILTYYIHYKLYNINKTGNKVALSISELINILGLANNTYSLATYKKKELSNILDIELVAISNFYSSTRREFKKIIERALNSMEKRRIILPNKRYVIVTKDKKEINKRCANATETELILQAERTVLDYFGAETKRDIFLKGQKVYNEFHDLVMDELPFYSYYQAYYIICNRKAINKKVNEIMEQKKKLNNKSIDRLEKLFKIVDQNSNEQKLINKLVSFKGYDLNIDDLIKSENEKNKHNYYEELRKQNKKINEENYKRYKIEEDYKNKDIVDNKELYKYKYKSKRHNQHEEYWNHLLSQIDTYDI